MELALAVGVLLASLSVTYLCCLKPMRRSGALAQDVRGLEPAARDEEMGQLRADVAALRADRPHQRTDGGGRAQRSRLKAHGT